MKIIGINYLSESSVALIENGKIKYAISQERLNRIKNWYGNPYEAVKYVLKETNNKIEDIDLFATHGLSALYDRIPNENDFYLKLERISKSKIEEKIKKRQINSLMKRKKHEIKVQKRTLKNINLLKNKYKKLKIYDHHHAHAASAYFYSGWKNCKVLTIDGWGDHVSSRFYYAKNGKLKNLSSSSSIDSLGYFYGSITKLLGYKPHRHEGKILGLAAFGDYKKAYKYFLKMISYDKKNKCFRGNFENGIYSANFDNPNLNFLKRKFTPADIAAACQKRIEDVIVQFLKDNLKRRTKLALAGGIFANVKINQIISELKNVSEIFIFPNMGDGGLAVGSAILAHNEAKKYKPQNINTMYLGPKFSNLEVLKELKKNKSLKYKRYSFPEKFLAKKLTEGKVVACFQGRMEFGPRALGNRSILVNACKTNVNKWLNKKLKRTEFMPFAPMTLDADAHGCYKLLNTKKKAIKFMTSTAKCTKLMMKKSPAAVHIDRTARPQILDKNTNPKIYKLLKHYKKISNIPTLINTSFNVHEEPIVCNPNDAIRAFKTSKLDYLYMEDYIINN